MGRTKTHTGRIDSKLKLEISKTGKPYLSFILKTNKELVACIAFDEMAELIYSSYKKDQDCTVIGGQKSSEEEVYVKHFRTEALETDRKIRLFGSAEGYIEYHRKVESDFTSKGYVKTRDKNGTFFVKKNRAIQVGMEHQLKIDYIMDMLGPDFVTSELRKHLGIDSLSELTGVKQSFKQRYELLLAHLLDKAQYAERANNADTL